MTNNFRPNDLNEIIALYPPRPPKTCSPHQGFAPEKGVRNQIFIELLWPSAQSEADGHRK
jgi:hypothetical protein